MATKIKLKNYNKNDTSINNYTNKQQEKKTRK